MVDPTGHYASFLQPRNQKVKVVTDTGTNKSSGSTTTATSKTTPTPTTPAPSSGLGGGGSSVWYMSSEEEAEIFYNELLLQRDTLLNDITELYSRADAFNEEHAILEKRGLKLADRFHQRNINDIFTEVGNMVLGVPSYAFGDAEGVASALESAYSFFGIDIVINNMRTNNVELKLLDIAGQLIKNELSLTTYDKLIEKYEERYGFTNE